jgi:hypothetical protein
MIFFEFEEAEQRAEQPDKGLSAEPSSDKTDV